MSQKFHQTTPTTSTLRKYTCWIKRSHEIRNKRLGYSWQLGVLVSDWQSIHFNLIIGTDIVVFKVALYRNAQLKTTDVNSCLFRRKNLNHVMSTHADKYDCRLRVRNVLDRRSETALGCWKHSAVQRRGASIDHCVLHTRSNLHQATLQPICSEANK